MKTFFIFFAMLAFSLQGGEKDEFQAYEIIIESEQDVKLAAWQTLLIFDSQKIKVTGIEGGEKPFQQPADYDSRGLTRGKLILASYSLEEPLANKKFIVGKIHFFGDPEALKNIKMELKVAGNQAGEKIAVKVSLRRIISHE